MEGESARRTLGDYFTLQRGTTYKSQLLGQPGPVLLGLATIERNGGFRTDSLRTYGGDSPDQLLVQPGELYVSLKDVTQSADLLGAVARLPLDQSPGRLTQDTVKLVPKGADVPHDYLYWLLRTPQYRSYCRAHATGTTNLGLARDDFLAFPAPEPTPSQRRIVNTLDALDNKIELNRRVNETLEAIARTLFKSWFVDFDPVRAKAEGRDPGLPEHIADLFPDRFEDSELGEIPVGWRIGKLVEYASLNPESWSRSTAPNKIVYVDLANTKWGRIEETQGLLWKNAPSRAQRILRPGDTIVGTVRPGNGSFSLVAEEGLTGSTGFAVLRPHKPIYEELVYLTATSPENIERLAHLADGAAYPAVRPDVVLATKTAQPSEPLVKTFSRTIKPFMSRIAAHRNESRTLAGIRDALLQKLVSGEIRIADVEQVIGGLE